MTSRRSFLAALMGATGAAAIDPERLLWRPGARTYSIPATVVAPWVSNVTGLNCVPRYEWYDNQPWIQFDVQWEAVTDPRVAALHLYDERGVMLGAVWDGGGLSTSSMPAPEEPEKRVYVVSVDTCGRQNPMEQSPSVSLTASHRQLFDQTSSQVSGIRPITVRNEAYPNRFRRTMPVYPQDTAPGSESVMAGRMLGGSALRRS